MWHYAERPCEGPLIFSSDFPLSTCPDVGKSSCIVRPVGV